MKPTVILILGEKSIAIARQIQAVIANSTIYGLTSRTQNADRQYTKFSETISELFTQGHPIIGICAAGILIRSLAPLLSDKRAEPPVIAIAEDGSAVVPLLGGLNGANDIARAIANVLNVQPSITTTGDLRFQISLLSPPHGYRLLNSDQQAKIFLADLLAGALVKLVGEASWLSESDLHFADDATHTIELVSSELISSELDAIASKLSSTHLIYQTAPIQNVTAIGTVSIIGTGPGSAKWMSPEVKAILESATDFVGYKTYINLVKEFTKGKTIHASDNRVELDRAHHALNLAAQGKSVVIVSSGDPGIYGMASAVFEVLDHEADPKWNQIDIHVAPGISAVQAAAASIGAPIGHDFCTISLSDILKPWEVIEQRLSAAAQADFVIAIYNPISTQRKWQLTAAKEILLQWRSPNTPVILGHKMGRKGENVQVIALVDLAPELADMQTVIIIGSSKTKTLKIGDRLRVYTPRKYSLPSE
jgi:cobalt-precorrin 5A hydrolase/precorrin-3B C17-methyltransferase